MGTSTHRILPNELCGKMPPCAHRLRHHYNGLPASKAPHRINSVLVFSLMNSFTRKNRKFVCIFLCTVWLTAQNSKHQSVIFDSDFWWSVITVNTSAVTSLNGIEINDGCLDKHDCTEYATKSQLDKSHEFEQFQSWTTYEGNPNQDRCALCFFGLPRAFQSMVLPSITQNLLIPNARHNCDVYVHFFNRMEEGTGRKNRGGKLDPQQIYLLEKAVRDVQTQHGPPQDARTHRETTVAFSHDFEEDFWRKRGDIVAKFQNTTKPEDGKPMYFPYHEQSYLKSSVDNIVRQWHSIENVFKLMENSATRKGVQYSRVAMLRSDVMYLTPIDIALLDQGIPDIHNNHMVTAGFALFPVNDRMIYGNYRGVKIWATQRFELVEQRALARNEPGFVLHSERFLNNTVFPAIEAAGYSVDTNRDICFVRTRADESVIISDCRMSGSPRGWEDVDMQALVETMMKKNGTKFEIDKDYECVGFRDGTEYQNYK